MKNPFYKSYIVLFLLLISIFSINNKAHACIDPETLITVDVQYSEDLTEIEIRLGNLKFQNEQPNVFCSCALSSYEDFFTHPTYIAFVLEGTNNPYPNFEIWENTTEADDAWNSEFPNYPSWGGYIAEVINGGLTVDDAVDLVIRASIPPGYYVVISELDTVLSLMTLGTDMWLPDEGTMAFDHTGLRNIGIDNSSLTMNEVSKDYFDILDDGILSSDDEILKEEIKTIIFPNPLSNQLNVQLNMPHPMEANILIRDISGKLLQILYEGNFHEGQQYLNFDLSDVLPKEGLYFLEIKTEIGIIMKKIIKQ